MMQTPRSLVRTEAGAEPTLGALLTRFARTTVPARLYQLLWLGVPFAIDFGLHGQWRAAAWGVAVAALGLWGVADRWVWQASESEGWRGRAVRVLRATAGAVAGSSAGLLLIELFLRLLGSAPTF